VERDSLLPDGVRPDQGADQEFLDAVLEERGTRIRQGLDQEAISRTVEIHLPEHVGIGAAALAMQTGERVAVSQSLSTQVS